MRAIRDRLRLIYGIPVERPHGDGLAELILTVLSQSTNDRNRDIAYFGLRERFPTWAEVRDAPVDEIELAIRRNEQVTRIARQRADRTHDFFVHRAGRLFYVARLRITQRFAQSKNGGINGFGIT